MTEQMTFEPGVKEYRSPHDLHSYTTSVAVPHMPQSIHNRKLAL